MKVGLTIIKTDYSKGQRQLGEEINGGSHAYSIFVKFEGYVRSVVENNIKESLWSDGCPPFLLTTKLYLSKCEKNMPTWQYPETGSKKKVRHL